MSMTVLFLQIQYKLKIWDLHAAQHVQLQSQIKYTFVLCYRKLYQTPQMGISPETSPLTVTLSLYKKNSLPETRANYKETKRIPFSPHSKDIEN